VVGLRDISGQGLCCGTSFALLLPFPRLLLLLLLLLTACLWHCLAHLKGLGLSSRGMLSWHRSLLGCQARLFYHFRLVNRLLSRIRAVLSAAIWVCSFLQYVCKALATAAFAAGATVADPNTAGLGCSSTSTTYWRQQPARSFRDQREQLDGRCLAPHAVQCKARGAAPGPGIGRTGHDMLLYYLFIHVKLIWSVCRG
jgi:hypothetical protein